MRRILAFLCLSLVLASLLSGCGLFVEKPTVTEGRFNFTVVYEVNGETVTLTDVYVCRYAGTEWSLDGGSHRSWEDFFENGSLGDGLLTVATTDEGHAIHLVINNRPEYFMSDPTYYGTIPPDIHMRITCTDGESLSCVYDEEEIASHGVRLLGYEYDEPIANEYH